MNLYIKKNNKFQKVYTTEQVAGMMGITKNNLRAKLYYHGFLQNYEVIYQISNIKFWIEKSV